MKKSFLKKILPLVFLCIFLTSVFFFGKFSNKVFAWEVDYPFNPPKEGDLPSFINYIYTTSFFVGSFLAVLMIIIGGIQWATPTSNPNVKFAAKKRITNAIVGLILLFTMYLILNAINPDFLRLKDINPQENQIQHSQAPDYEDWRETGVIKCTCNASNHYECSNRTSGNCSAPTYCTEGWTSAYKVGQEESSPCANRNWEKICVCSGPGKTLNYECTGRTSGKCNDNEFCYGVSPDRPCK